MKKLETKFTSQDPYLQAFLEQIQLRVANVNKVRDRILSGAESLIDFSSGHLYFGQHGTIKRPIFREYAPNATNLYLVGDFSNWQEQVNFRFCKCERGCWELELEEGVVKEGDNYFLSIHYAGGFGTRIPAYAKSLQQDEVTKFFCAKIIDSEKNYIFKYSRPKIDTPLIYEAHVGMSSEELKVSTFKEFREQRLPYIAKLGYNTVQLMAIQEHPYYGSYGYHVANFFAVSSRFGSPNELKQLVDEAHALGLAVVMDLVHSHSVKNEQEGLAVYDGDSGLYFHTDSRRFHKAWDSLCFNYGKDDVLHFLLSNCKYWMEEYQLDGFRFDGVTSMLYLDHGLERAFTSYNDYYDGNQDEDALVYLSLANELIHQIYPQAMCLAEEMSGMPGLCSPIEDGGLGFDYRLAMGIPDYWIKLCKDRPDESWEPGDIFYQLTSKRVEERTINYAESHDQALVGDKTLITHLLGSEIYTHMHRSQESLIVDRGIALHKIIRLVTFGLAQGAYLNFMGNEFGHPEWIDFPRIGNDWSYQYARRQWSLIKNQDLKYAWLGEFDKDMIQLERKNHFINQSDCYCVYDDRHGQVLAFTRGDLLFVFNFHPSESYKDLSIKVKKGKYRIILNTDDLQYGGFGRIDNTLDYLTQQDETLKLYLTSRTGLVLSL